MFFDVFKIKCKKLFYIIICIFFIKNDALSLGLTTHGNKISIKGSETMLELSYILSKYYVEKLNPNLKMQIMGGGSGVGIASMINEITDLANSSRSIKEQELKMIKVKKKLLKSWIIALDAIIIYVNKDNPIAFIHIQDLKAIYLGKIKNWKLLGGLDQPIVLYGRESNSGTYFFFKKKILNKKDFYHRIISLSGNGSIVNAVGEDRNAIGYGGYTQSTKVKLLPIKTDKEIFVPSVMNIKASKYPFIRPLYIYALADKYKQIHIKKYVDWLLEEKAQSLIEKSGYFPIIK